LIRVVNIRADINSASRAVLSLLLISRGDHVRRKTFGRLGATLTPAISTTDRDHMEGTEQAAIVEQQTPPLSKKALKRQLKRQRWEESKGERRALQKAKLRQKKEEFKRTGQKFPKKRKPVVKGQESSGVRVVLDCAFDDLMNEKVARHARC
jgi:hypothetical protein